MPRQNAEFLHFNRGEVSPLALGRIDVERILLSAETVVNWLPKTLGPMSKRAGWIYRGATASNNACQVIPFIGGTTDTAMIEITDSVVRVWEATPLAPITFGTVTNNINNTAFAAQGSWVITGSANGGTCAFGGSGLQLQPGARGGLAKCTQQVTTTETGSEHCLVIVVPAGYDPVMLRVGSTAGDDDYIEETRLLSGEHWLAFTPTGDFHLTFWAKDNYGAERRVTSCTLASAGAMAITAPWAAADLDKIQYAQSADVVFVACNGITPKRIERRSTRSWSVVDYYHPDGPFVGKTAELQIKANATEGRVTLTADADIFRSTHVGSLFRLFHDGQNFTQTIAGDGISTDPIRVAGVQQTNYNERAFAVTSAGTWAGTAKVHRSIVAEDQGYGPYPRDASAGTATDITTNTTYNNEDVDDNLVAWYRVGFTDGDYTSGQLAVTFAYAFGGGHGIVKVDAVASATSATAEVLRLLRGTTYTAAWSEGAWNGFQGYPSGVALFEGRLCWVAGAHIWMSVSDNYESFDQENVNDDGPIIRTIAEGPVDNIHWLLPLERLFLGTAGGEFMVRSSSEDILTPTDFSIKVSSTIGSKSFFPAVVLDDFGLFIDRSGNRLMQISPHTEGPAGYDTVDLNLLHPKILKNGSGVVSMAVQRRPDTRVYCVLSDGTCAVLTYDRAEDVLAWSRITTGTSGAPGAIERVFVLSTTGDDQVFFVVNRTIGGATKRYVEEMAEDDKADGDNECYLSDSCVYWTGASTVTISGFDHLEGEDVVVWADGDVVETSEGVPKTFTVTGGDITLDTAATSVVAGLSYTAQWKSMKLAYAAGGGSALTRHKRVIDLGLMLHNTHHAGLEYGRSFTSGEMNLLSQIYEGAAVAAGTIHTHYDEPMIPFPGDWDTDSRLCLQSAGPYPATCLGAVVGVQTSG